MQQPIFLLQSFKVKMCSFKSMIDRMPKYIAAAAALRPLQIAIRREIFQHFLRCIFGQIFTMNDIGIGTDYLTWLSCSPHLAPDFLPIS